MVNSILVAECGQYEVARAGAQAVRHYTLFRNRCPLGVRLGSHGMAVMSLLSPKQQNFDNRSLCE